MDYVESLDLEPSITSLDSSPSSQSSVDIEAYSNLGADFDIQTFDVDAMLNNITQGVNAHVAQVNSIRKRFAKGANSFLCHSCDRRFDRRCDLNKHIKHKHKPPQLQCTDCPKTFRWPKDLRRHISAMHSSYTPIPFVEPPAYSPVSSPPTPSLEFPSFEGEEALDPAFGSRARAPRFEWPACSPASSSPTPLLEFPLFESEEGLDSAFRERARAPGFWELGKVFLVLWTEPKSETQMTSHHQDVDLGRFGEKFLTKTRRFVIIRSHTHPASDGSGDVQHMTAIPIRTYGGRGVGACSSHASRAVLGHYVRPAASDPAVPEDNLMILDVQTDPRTAAQQARTRYNEARARYEEARAQWEVACSRYAEEMPQCATQHHAVAQDHSRQLLMPQAMDPSDRGANGSAHTTPSASAPPDHSKPFGSTWPSLNVRTALQSYIFYALSLSHGPQPRDPARPGPRPRRREALCPGSSIAQGISARKSAVEGVAIVGSFRLLQDVVDRSWDGRRSDMRAKPPRIDEAQDCDDGSLNSYWSVAIAVIATLVAQR
nr:hypothetical protein B0A51_08758 [Rachicladosporium sp. CCFEE 5018]